MDDRTRATGNNGNIRDAVCWLSDGYVSLRLRPTHLFQESYTEVVAVTRELMHKCGVSDTEVGMIIGCDISDFP